MQFENKWQNRVWMKKTQTKPFNYFATPNDIQCFSQDWNVLWPDKLLEPVSHPVDQCLIFSFTCPNPFSIGHFPLHRIGEQFCGCSLPTTYAHLCPSKREQMGVVYKGSSVKQCGCRWPCSPSRLTGIPDAALPVCQAPWTLCLCSLIWLFTTTL